MRLSMQGVWWGDSRGQIVGMQQRGTFNECVLQRWSREYLCGVRTGGENDVPEGFNNERWTAVDG